MPAGSERKPGTPARPGSESPAELEDRLELQARVLDALQDAVVTLDPELRVRSLNRAAEQLYRWGEAEALGRHLDDLLGREFVDGADGRQLMFQGAAAAGRHRVVLLQHRRNGAALEAEAEATALRDGAGRLTGFILVSRDVTERRQAQEALRRSEERLRAIIETEPECVKVVGPDGLLLEMNPSGLAMLEAGSLAEAQARPLADYVTGNREGFIGLFHQVMAGGSGRLEFQVTGLRGTRRILETNAVPMRGKDGRIAGLLGVTRDITERRRAEDALRRSEERFRVLIERSSDLLLVLDGAGRVTFASPSTVDALGQPLDELLGKDLHALVHPEDRAAVEAAVGALRAGRGATWRVVARAGRPGRPWRLFELVGRDLLDTPAVAGLVVNARDITEQDRLQSQLSQAQKLESIGRLAGGVAHDFNNLLLTILANVEFLEEGLRAGAPRPEDLHDIRVAAERARDLTAQLLAVARRQVIAPRKLDVATELRQAEKLLGRILGEDVALEVRLGEGLGSIQVDAGQLHQVILNLAINARDAMPSGGRLVIEASNVDLDDRWAAAHPGTAPGPHVLLRFTDSGEGMSDEVKAHVFEPFFTTKPVGRGTGLGLATVYGIVTQNRGSIDWQSQPGVGTTFNVHFPRAVQALPSRPEPLPVTGGRTGETVLVVEDEAAVRAVAVRTLEAAGYRVLSADGGPAALELLARSAGKVDLLLTDVVMPGMSGIEVARAMQARQPSLRVLYMSGYATDTVARHGGLELGDALLTKPFTPSALVASVRKFLGAAG
jgi:PAS domain S-box-containing protein